MVARVPIRVLATPNPGRAAAALAHGDLGVALFHSGRPELPGLGAGLIEAASMLPTSPSVRAWDFLSIALAVHAADRFVVRDKAQDSWTRMIALEVELAAPEAWATQAEAIANLLRFLTGDIWYLRFRNGGMRPPDLTGNLYDDRDCACLFSGGMDSLIGAIDLLNSGRRPLLISQASPKEGLVQASLAEKIGLSQHRFEGRASERWRQPYEPSSRARSILFIGYGVVAASSLASADRAVDLVIPENGLISINAPLTLRHIGSLSTRTTHPHFISSLHRVLQEVGLSVNLVNPYSFKTKGEMLRECCHTDLQRLASESYSCGKGKRLNKHCGRCVPCLIRRASFYAAGIPDGTGYWAENLAEHILNVDVSSARYAAANLVSRDVSRWVAEAGPLPMDRDHRHAYVEVVRRGTEELRNYFSTIAWS